MVSEKEIVNEINNTEEEITEENIVVESKIEEQKTQEEADIPEKEKDIVKTKKKNRMVNKSKKDKLDELESLYKDGVITESEYKESRSNILSS